MLPQPSVASRALMVVPEAPLAKATVPEVAVANVKDLAVMRSQ